jgi:hypothetical protein
MDYVVVGNGFNGSSGFFYPHYPLNPSTNPFELKNMLKKNQNAGIMTRLQKCTYITNGLLKTQCFVEIRRELHSKVVTKPKDFYC